MKRRERQYINWINFWRKRKPPIVEEHGFIHGWEYKKFSITGGSIRVPDTMLKKMGLNKLKQK